MQKISEEMSNEVEIPSETFLKSHGLPLFRKFRKMLFRLSLEILWKFKPEFFIKWIAPPDHSNNTKVCWSHFETISGGETTTAAVKVIHS